MNDRELLESAAKAAGYKLERFISALYPYATIYTVKGKQWDPLADDGDALRLAVELRISVSIGKDVVEAHIGQSYGKLEASRSNLLSATRRAIVRAAAEIGRQMQEEGAA
jgi:hypothetical protein